VEENIVKYIHPNGIGKVKLKLKFIQGICLSSKSREYDHVKYWCELIYFSANMKAKDCCFHKHSSWTDCDNKTPFSPRTSQLLVRRNSIRQVKSDPNFSARNKYKERHSGKGSVLYLQIKMTYKYSITKCLMVYKNAVLVTIN